MSPPLLNQLLEEAVQRCNELAARSLAGASAAGEVIEGAKALGLTAVQDGEHLKQEYAKAIAAIKEATARIGHAGESADQGLAALVEEAVTAATAVAAMEKDADQALDAVSQRRKSGFGALHGSVTAAEVEFQGVAHLLSAFETHLDDHLQAAQTELAAVEHAMEAAAKTVGEARQHAQEAMDGLGQLAGAASHAVAHALEQALAATGVDLIGCANAGVGALNAVVAAARFGYLDESPGDLEPEHTHVKTAFDAIHRSIERFGQLTDPAHSTLQAATHAIVERAEQVFAGLGEVSESLQHSLERVQE